MFQTTALYRYISGRKTLLKELVFYGGVVLYLLFLYIQLQDVPARDQLIPLYVVQGTLVLCLVGIVVTFIVHIVKPDVVQKTFPQFYSDQQDSQEDRSEQPDDQVSEGNEQTSESSSDAFVQFSSKISSFSLTSLRGSESVQKMLHFATPLLYIILIPALGFFSSTFIFTFIHSKLTDRGYFPSLGFALLLTGALWVLFIEILGRRVILSIGILI